MKKLISFVLILSLLATTLATGVSATTEPYQKVLNFENYEVGATPYFLEDHPGETGTPNYPSDDKWALSAANGYVVSAPNTSGDITKLYTGTFIETLYDAAGNASSVKQSYSYRNVGNWGHNLKGVSVVSGGANGTAQALQVTYKDLAHALTLEVEPNTKYTLTYYAKNATAGNTNVNFGTAILSSLNFSGAVHSSGGGSISIIGNNLPNHVAGNANVAALQPYTFANVGSTLTDNWVKYSMEFTTAAVHEQVYFVVCNKAAHGCNALLDELTLTEVIESSTPEDPEVTHSAKAVLIGPDGEAFETNNAPITAEITAKDSGYTLTTTCNNDRGLYSFIGWFDSDDNLVSAESTATVTAAGNYTAKYSTANLLEADSFESYADGTSLKHTAISNQFPTGVQLGGIKTAGYRGQTFAGTIYTNTGSQLTQINSGSLDAASSLVANVNNDTAHTGSNSLYVKQPYWGSAMAIENVKPGATYNISFWIKSANTSTKFKNLAVSTTVNFGPSANISGFATSHLLNNLGTFGLALNDGATSAQNFAVSNTEWTEFTAKFTVPESATELDTLYIVFDSSGAAEGGELVTSFYIDDLSVIEKFEGIKTAYNNACALREGSASSTGKNGLRVYNSIEKSFIESVGIVEYGSLVALSNSLTGELTVNTAGSVKGIAYNSTTLPDAILWDSDDDCNYFTAYLTGIPDIFFDEFFTIRSYAVDKNGRTYYGEEISISVFDVLYAMDNAKALTTQTDNDVLAFNAFAKGEDGLYTKYDKWLKDNLVFAGKLRNIAKAEDTLSGEALTNALEVDGYYEPFFERAIANEGNRALLKAMFEKAERGEDITVVGFGGSITQKAACTNELDSFSHLVAQWLREKFHVTVNWYNAGIGSTTSVLGIARMQDHVLAYNPDLVIIDFTTNDQSNDYHAGSYEAILRTLYEKNIAFVTIAFGNVNNTLYKEGVYCRGSNREDLHGPVMLYNDAPVIDYYGVLWDCYLDGDLDGYNVESDAAHWNVLWADYIHPTKVGHKLAAGAINYYLGKVYDDMDNITEVVACPETPYDQYTENFMGAMMYGSANAGELITASEGVTIGDYNNYDSTTVTNWTIWKIAAGGYLEFTIPNAKLFALMSINGPDAPVADIYINDVNITTHRANRTSELNWMNYIKFFDGAETVKVKIACTSGTYRITAGLIA